MSQEAWHGGSRHDADDTSDRLYTPDDFAAYAARRDAREGGAGGREPLTYGDPLTDGLDDPLTDPTPDASGAEIVSRPTAPPPSYRPATPPPAGPPPAQRQPVEAPAAHAAPPEPTDDEPEMRRFMSATDFLDRRDADQDLGPANWGWRGKMRRWTGGLVNPKMGAEERSYVEDRRLIQRDFDGPRTIAFINPKGGAAKTTGVLAAGYTFGTVRGGGVVAWDNNETRGTLGIRGTRSAHRNTTRELLEDLERFTDVYQSRIGDLGAFVRSQGDAHFDVLASDERPDVTGTIRAQDFDAIHKLLERFYRVILIDTGNNMRAENWLAAAGAADLLVVTSTVREDTGYSGLWMLDALQDAGYQNLKHKTVTVLSDPSATVDSKLAADLVDVYQQRTRGVYRVPYDPALVAGSVVPYSQLSQHTRMQWLKACAGMAAAL
ncbi:MULTISPECIES: MinD/ParA family ATP-binding protein [unclassified Nocardioides]|uniref:MinD/ParA family ATP-binding protein n=1 Tax=unclassified Nocardioides TaxID=2615069 RepID=UPI0036190DA6